MAQTTKKKTNLTAKDRQLLKTDLPKKTYDEKKKLNLTKTKVLDKLMGINGDINLNSKQTWDTILAKADQGMTINEIRGVLGVTKAEWERALEMYAGFATTMEFAKIRFESYLQTAARRRVQEGSDKMIQFMLERCVDGFKPESTIKIEGSSTLTVQTFAEYKASLLTKQVDDDE